MTTPTIEDLPPEIMERIFSFLSPYNDLDQASSVNKRWQGMAESTLTVLNRKLDNAITTGKLKWKHLGGESNEPSSQGRAGHGCCVVKHFMYLFAGFTTKWDFLNDLWKLNLKSRTWTKLEPRGEIPPRMTCTSMFVYGEQLLVFGRFWIEGKDYSSQLYIYDIPTNEWSEASTPGAFQEHEYKPCLVGSKMIFLRLRLTSRSAINVIWILDVPNMSWHSVRTTTSLHKYRLHEEVVIDDRHMLFFTKMSCGHLSIWMLSTKSDEDTFWEWREVDIQQHEYGPLSDIDMSRTLCLVGNKVVMFEKLRPAAASENETKSPKDMEIEVSSDSENETERPIDMEIEVSSHSENETERPKDLEIEVSSDSEYEMENGGSSDSENERERSHGLYFLCVLDISEAITENRVTWLSPKSLEESGLDNFCRIFDDTHTLVLGKGELVMFGRWKTSQDNSYLHFISAP